ncbi:uncharacterized protein BDZ99DRAFT_464466 [Mytilinidion resinicola]|uniref:Uncharacterized protein n=1 Tax=Mytilinidion resinicola TaxID=574789 RepID=A0A6A6YIJ8_9PEZI|nr:uncharacterized protein BDZ99DRAFT_464466 [Mytilinidion resinicola]KAF2808620.1 hypothetical protein BDZ99DRAFT_464466 [Mytilinidion resinicola]
MKFTHARGLFCVVLSSAKTQDDSVLPGFLERENACRVAHKEYTNRDDLADDRSTTRSPSKTGTKIAWNEARGWNIDNVAQTKSIKATAQHERRKRTGAIANRMQVAQVGATFLVG